MNEMWQQLWWGRGEGITEGGRWRGDWFLFPTPSFPRPVSLYFYAASAASVVVSQPLLVGGVPVIFECDFQSQRENGMGLRNSPSRAAGTVNFHACSTRETSPDSTPPLHSRIPPSVCIE